LKLSEVTTAVFGTRIAGVVEGAHKCTKRYLAAMVFDG
jgi:hypothetical protein